MAEEKDIKYINREFTDLRQDLIEYAKNYFPDSYNDFSATSPGMMFIEMASYVGDVLSFYQDNQLQETFLQHAKNPSNLYTLAYMMGYSPKVSTAAEATITITQEVDATTVSGSGIIPNWDQAVRISENGTIKATTSANPTFIIEDAVDFKYSSSYDPTEVTINEFNSGSNTPNTFLLKKQANAFSGTIKSTDFEFTTAEKFATVTVSDTNIIKVLDITDSDGNSWYEVPFLAQDTIFTEEANTGEDSDLVSRNLKLTRVPRRFISRFTSTGDLQIQFGSGITSAEDTEFIPNPSTIASGSRQSVDKLDKAYDPSNFLFTKTYGIAPSNTTLTVRYLTGGGVESNAPANTITEIGAITTSATDSSKASTLAFNNIKPASGGRDGDTVEELRQNSLKAFAEQKRAVTLQDYTVRALSLPPQFGSIAKVYVARDPMANTDRSVLDKNPLALALYVLAYDADGKLTVASNKLKQNLKTYLSQYMLITDAIDIKDAFVVNIGIQFEILTLPSAASREVLAKCTTELQEYLKTANMNINKPINLSTLFTLLDQVKGVQTVKKITVTNKQGGNYSNYAYDVKGATKENIVYPSYDPCIFELKYPNLDIEGRITTL